MKTKSALLGTLFILSSFAVARAAGLGAWVKAGTGLPTGPDAIQSDYGPGLAIGGGLRYGLVPAISFVLEGDLTKLNLSASAFGAGPYVAVSGGDIKLLTVGAGFRVQPPKLLKYIPYAKVRGGLVTSAIDPIVVVDSTPSLPKTTVTLEEDKKQSHMLGFGFGFTGGPPGPIKGFIEAEYILTGLQSTDLSGMDKDTSYVILTAGIRFR